MGAPRYDRIGRTYSAARVEDPRIAAQVHRALGDARSIVNVGAGTGNYEPSGATVIAVDPSLTMLGQRGGRPGHALCGTAEHLPLPDGACDAALAVLTLHHWTDLAAGLRELGRVARRQVIFYFEPLASQGAWMLDYFPEVAALPTEVAAPGLAEIESVLRVREVAPVLVPRDCTDGFAAAYWARPEAYLDPVVQAGMSSLATLPPAALAAGTRRLADDLASGEWHRRHGHVLEQEAYDGGYRLAVAGD